MKAIINAKSLIATLIIILIMSFTQAASSLDKSAPSVELEFLGKYTTGPLFRLKFNNSETGEFIIKVKDGEGNLFFSEKLKGNNLIRNYRINVSEEELYSFKAQFEVTNVKTKETSVYKVSNNDRVVTDIIIAKL
jgi:hypothetical protein